MNVASANSLHRLTNYLHCVRDKLNCFYCSADLTDLAGIYLPLLHQATACCRRPVVIAVVRSKNDSSYQFHPLVSKRASNSGAFQGGYWPTPNEHSAVESALPLVSHILEPLLVRCCHLPDDMQPEVAMDAYLQLVELPYTTSRGINMVTCAKLGDKTPDDEINDFDEVPDLSMYLPPRGNTPSGAAMSSDRTLCTNPGCKYYGLAEYDGRCSVCFRDYRVPRIIDEYDIALSGSLTYC